MSLPGRIGDEHTGVMQCYSPEEVERIENI